MTGRPKNFDPASALESAIEVFHSHGFEAASMSDLIQQMSINRQSVYDTFGDKRELFMGALREYTKKIGGELTAILTTGKSPLARVRNFLATVTAHTAKGNPHGCLLTNTIIELGPHDADIQSYISDVFKSLEQLLAKCLKEAVDAGELSPATDPKRLARIFLTLMQGAIVLSKTNLAGSTADALKTAESLLLLPP